MTRVFILFFILMSQTSMSQIVVVDSLDFKYEAARTLMHPYLQRVIRYWDTLTNELALPLEFDKILLNTTNFEKGNVIFGYAMISVPPYYITETMELDGPLFQQKKYEMYFKLEITQ